MKRKKKSLRRVSPHLPKKKTMELETIADWVFRVQLSVVACSGSPVDREFCMEEVLRAGSAHHFLLHLESTSQCFFASMISRMYGLATTAILTDEEQKIFDAFWVLVPKCHLCGSTCPELADVVDTRFGLCHACHQDPES